MGRSGKKIKIRVRYHQNSKIIFGLLIIKLGKTCQKCEHKKWKKQNWWWFGGWNEKKYPKLKKLKSLQKFSENNGRLQRIKKMDCQKFVLFYFDSQILGSVGSVKQLIKLVSPYAIPTYLCLQVSRLKRSLPVHVAKLSSVSTWTSMYKCASLRSLRRWASIRLRGNKKEL